MHQPTLLIVVGLACASGQTSSVVDYNWADPTNWPNAVADVKAHAATTPNGKLRIISSLPAPMSERGRKDTCGTRHEGQDT